MEVAFSESMQTARKEWLKMCKILVGLEFLTGVMLAILDRMSLLGADLQFNYGIVTMLST